MVTYSINYMGPVRLDWFRERGLTHVITERVETELLSKVKNLPIGSTYEIETVHTDYACGRIDIRDSSKEGYEGWNEYSVDPMHAEDWRAFGNFLMRLKGPEAVPYDTLIMLFEAEYGKSIRWAPDPIKDC